MTNKKILSFLGINKKNDDVKIDFFEELSPKETLEKNISLLNKEIDKDSNKKHHLKILQALSAHFNEHSKLKDDDIRKIFEDLKFKDDDPMEYIARYGENSTYRILPDIMTDDYYNIPDENGLSKFELLQIIQEYGLRINNIKNLERKLNSQLDCSLYAEQYLDTLEEVASLHRKRLIPQKVIDYFKNNFAYGINLINWYFKFVLEKKYNGNDDFVTFDPKVKISSSELEFETNNIDSRWVNFKWFCRGGESRKKVIESFHDCVNDKFITLPDSMYEYNYLPPEEGINPDKVLEIMREYSVQLTELSDKETKLKTQIDCSVYVEQYLDILEQIAYLFNNKALTTDVPTYFENNFAYGLTLKSWYDYKVFGAEGQENRWSEFLKYCENFEDDENNPKPIKSFNIRFVLPASMLYYDFLPIDLFDKKSSLEYPEDKIEFDSKLHEYDNL
ncbi:hypothetical protein C6990_02690 [Nitrosopumilus sp. b3]|uniref:hypothetical protein n=1 Tax=Nitrosopumilus sp. b3 TaxID=2109909 RepID=UPI0015F4C6E0|nr:hypothetical protein [Nitrosopumilus sp. b3]KAF6247392.1 hypothetical protein C6990_02690 [Nitrosopumilus sp. b3]